MLTECSLKTCNGKHYAKELCRKHYRQLSEYATRWKRIKSDPILYERRRQLQRKWEREHPRDYRQHVDKIYFGGLREKTVQRDGEKCVECGMTRNEHFQKWKKDLHVNHKDHTKMNTMEIGRAHV